jgi:hypothetical protein
VGAGRGGIWWGVEGGESSAKVEGLGWLTGRGVGGCKGEGLGAKLGKQG